MKKIVFGFILGFVASLLLYRMIGRHHEKLLDIARNFPKAVKINLDKEDTSHSGQ